MDARWPLAFGASLVLSVLVTPVVRGLARSCRFVDEPAGHKAHHLPTPYLGGVAIMLSVALVVAGVGQPSWRMGLVVCAGLLLGTMGLVDDDATLSPSLRLLVELVAALAAVFVGLRIHATGIVWLDLVITLVWIVGVTNAFNLLDNMDGLAAGVAGVVAVAVVALATVGHQPAAGVLAGTVAGACLGFLAYNRRPASIYMGDAGSLFLGFLLAIVTIDVNPSLAPPASFAVPLMLLALPVLDTTIVTLARLRHGRPVTQGGRDHLSHRLVALGLQPGAAVATLLGVQAVVATLAVLAGSEDIPLGLGMAGVMAVIAGLSLVTARVEVYPVPLVGLLRGLVGAARGPRATVVVLAPPPGASPAGGMDWE